MKYKVYRSDKDSLEYTLLADGVVDKKFVDRTVVAGETYGYKVEAVRDDGKYYDRDAITVVAEGEDGDLFPDEPDHEIDPLDCDAYEFTDNYTAFSTLVPVEMIQEATADEGWSLIPGATQDTEFTLIATEEVETRPIVGDQAGVEKRNVYVYEADIEWENKMMGNELGDTAVQLKWLHDVFQFKNGAPKSMLGVFFAAFTEMKCGMQLIRDAVENDLIKSPDLMYAFGGTRFSDGVPDFVGDAAPVNLVGAFAGCPRLNQELNIDTSNVERMEYTFYGALSFDKDISNWCVQSIGSKPEYFDDYSGFEGQTAKQPKWGQAC